MLERRACHSRQIARLRLTATLALATLVSVIEINPATEMESTMPKEFFIWKNEKMDGLHTLAQLQQMLLAGQVTEGILVCENGSKEWVPLSTVLKQAGNGLAVARDRKSVV